MNSQTPWERGKMNKVECSCVLRTDDGIFKCNKPEGHKGSHAANAKRYSVTWEHDEREKCDICGKLAGACMFCINCDKAFCFACRSTTPPLSECCKCEKKRQKKERKYLFTSDSLGGFPLD